MIRTPSRLLGCLVLTCLSAGAAAEAVSLSALRGPAAIVRDVDGIAHVRAVSEHDMFMLQGWAHARDRLYQMDENRRTASGTLAELLGPAALPSDVQLRTVGLRRAAVRSWAALRLRAADGDEVSAGTVAAVEAYTEGVNAFIAAADSLPPEYGALGLTGVDPWTPLDTVVIGKLIAFGLSFDLADIDNTVTLATYQGIAEATGGAFDPVALFFEDLFRSQPFDPAATVPDSGGGGQLQPGFRRASSSQAGAGATPRFDPGIAQMGRRYLDKAAAVPLLRQAFEQRDAGRGSNNWAVSAALSATGNPLVDSDPNLDLDHPSTFYPRQLTSPGYDAVGNGFAGAPFVIAGQNRHYVWGPTTHRMDVTDVFLDVVVQDPDSPSGLSIVLPGDRLGHLVPIPESYAANIDGNVMPGVHATTTLTVPSRYDGVVLDLDLAAGRALTVQYTGFGPTREFEAFYIWNKGRDLEDFRAGLERFDVGSQNFAYADRAGNVAFFTSAEMPVRADLETLRAPALGIPPYLIRIGADPRHQWLPQVNAYAGQTTPFEILSPAEMPQVVNPVRGYFVNANNDPLGFTNDNNPLNQLRDTGGIFYLSPGFRYATGFRAGRINERLERFLATGDGKLSVEEMAEIQADVGLLDASFFVPRLIAAYQAGLEAGAGPALAAAAGPGLADAIAALAHWRTLDYQAKTGIAEGYDAEDPTGDPAASLDDAEIAASVATTVYNVWRSSFIAATIDATLNAFPLPPDRIPRPDGSQAMTALKTLVERGGDSASGLDFFAGGAADQASDVQVVMLTSLEDALARLGGSEFAAVFNGSTNLDDYRWGRLHRIVFESRLGGPFSVPEAFGFFPAPLAGLRGIPTDGGLGTVDAAANDVRGHGPDGFMFDRGPTNRWVSDVTPAGPRSQSAWPGGTSAVPGDPFYLFPMLPRWLANDAEAVRFSAGEVNLGCLGTTVFDPR
jgi:penicillin amidase